MHGSMAKEFIFLFLLTTLPNLLTAQHLGDDNSDVELSVTEIRRVIPEDNETKDAKNYATQVTIEDPQLEEGNFQFSFQMVGYNDTLQAATKNVFLKNNRTVRIIFDITIPDQTNEQLLIARLNGNAKGVWRGKFIIEDTKARVAVIAEDYLRVTTGELDNVTFPGASELLVCENTTSPCYYSKDSFEEDFPPVTERCINLEYEEKMLIYCDDTITEFLPLSEEPSLILLDEEVLNLRYPTTNNTYEVLMIEKDIPLKKENIFKCSNYESPNNGCNMNISISGTEVDFIIVTVDESDFVEGSSNDTFNVIPVKVMRLTEDSVFASWETDLETFDVFIKTKTKLDDFEYKLNATRITDNRFESLFINVENDENYIAVVQHGNNAVAKTIKGDPTEQSEIYRIYKTEGVTFMVESNIENLHTVELIEVEVNDDLVENHYYSGTCNKTSRGYWFESTDVTVTINIERKFYLVGYNESNIPVICGVAYITFEDVEVELDVIGLKSSIVRAHVYGKKNVTVGNETCDASCTCYTEANEGDELICTEIENSAPNRNRSHLGQCENLKPSIPSELEDDPSLLLLESSDLYLRYDTNTAFAFEVLALDMEGHMISRNPNFTCVENDGGCYMGDILPEGFSLVDFTINSIHQNGSLMESKDYLFENVPLDARYLTDDAVITNWKSEYEGLSASIRIWPDLDDNKYSSNDICDSTTLCEYFFILPEVSDYIAVISNGTNSVAKNITKDPVVESAVKKISKTTDPNVTVFSVERNTASSQFKVKLIEVSESGETVTNILHEGDMAEKSRTLYEYSTSDDIMKIAEESKFLLVEYSNEQISGAAPAYVTFVEFDAVELEWIANSKILRSSVHDDRNFLIGDEYCNNSVSACYHSASLDVLEYIPICTEAVNAAKCTQKNLLLCEDQKPENTKELTVNELHLQEDNGGKISLTADCIETSEHVGLALYSSGIPLDSAEVKCLKEIDNTCSVEPLHLPVSSEHLDVVVVCTSEDIVTSSIVPVEDLKFTAKKIGETSMLVQWTVANADEYVARLKTDEDIPARVGTELTSEIICEKDSCYSTFFDIDLKLDYHLIISKQGDDTSFTEKHIDSLDTEEEPEHVLITKVSRVCDSETKVFLTEKCRHEVTVLAKLLDGTSTDISGIGEAVDSDYTIFKFTHSETIFDKENVIFSVLDSEKDTFYHTGIADVSLHRLDTTVAWVGAERNTKGASLRVDVGNQKQVELGNLKCEKENSPCYFFEVVSSDLPKYLERCVLLETNVLQCDEEVTPFEAMDKKDVNITFEDNMLKVAAPLSESNSHIEITSYDPSDPSTSLSKENVTCTGSVLKNTEMVECKQPVQLQNSQSDIKVIVAEVNVKGKTLKSIVTEINIPSFGVESWVIAVSVLSSLVFLATASYFIIVILKKKKLQKWESDAIKKEVKTIDTIGTSNIDQDVSRASRDSISDRSISLPERHMFNRRSPPPLRRLDNFSTRQFSREIDRFPRESNDGYPVERGSHNLKALPPPESCNEMRPVNYMKALPPPESCNEMRPINYMKPRPPLGRDNKAFVSSESDGMTDSQPMRMPKINLSSRVNMSSLQTRMSQYQQTRI